MSATSIPDRGHDDTATRDASPPDAYRELAPASAVRPYVDCLWSRGAPLAPAPARTHRVLPDGCVDIVLRFHGTLIDASVVGTMTRALVVHQDVRDHFVGIRFRPGVAHLLFGVPAADLTDLRPPLAELWSDASDALAVVAEAPDIASRVHAAEHMLMRRIAASRPAVMPEVDAALRLIHRAGGNLSIAALGPTLGVTRQHLARCFARAVGVSPKMFARVTRVRAAVARVRGMRDVDWGALAADLGFYDQSHLTHELKELTGLAPRQWVGIR